MEEPKIFGQLVDKLFGRSSTFALACTKRVAAAEIAVGSMLQDLQQHFCSALIYI